jgi:hypothetical protein
MINASILNISANQIAGFEKSLPVPVFQSPNLVIRRVTEKQDQLATDDLVRRMYGWRGYRVKRQAETPYDHDRITLAAWQDGNLAGTLTLSCDNERGLLCESLYPAEVSALRAKGLKICECSRLAIDPDFSSRSLLESFLQSAYDFARLHFGATDALIEVNPRHCRYYENEFGFSRLGPRRLCPRVQAPALLLHHDFTSCQPISRGNRLAA